MNQKTIRVQGKGSASQAPDRIRITFTLTGTDPDFSKAIEASEKAATAVRSAAQKCGIEASELKTTHFDVREDTEYNSGRHLLVGFKATHQIGITLPIENDLV
jgi:uncharacterized protein YggE